MASKGHPSAAACPYMAAVTDPAALPPALPSPPTGHATEAPRRVAVAPARRRVAAGDPRQGDLFGPRETMDAANAVPPCPGSAGPVEKPPVSAAGGGSPGAADTARPAGGRAVRSRRKVAKGAERPGTPGPKADRTEERADHTDAHVPDAHVPDARVTMQAPAVGQPAAIPPAVEAAPGVTAMPAAPSVAGLVRAPPAEPPVLRRVDPLAFRVSDRPDLWLYHVTTGEAAAPLLRGILPPDEAAPLLERGAVAARLAALAEELGPGGERPGALAVLRLRRREVEDRLCPQPGGGWKLG